MCDGYSETMDVRFTKCCDNDCQFCIEKNGLINLVSGYIDTKEKIIIFIETLKKIGCRHIKINELQNVGKDSYVSFDKIYNIKQQSPYSCGCQTDITELINMGIKITLKRCCFKVLDPVIAKATFGDLIKAIIKRFYTPVSKFKVLYENGKLENNWKLNREENL